MTWARGYGYAGAPVENVLANRHVELSTNAGSSGRSVTCSARATRTHAGSGARDGADRVTDLLRPTGVDEGRGPRPCSARRHRGTRWSGRERRFGRERHPGRSAERGRCVRVRRRADGRTDFGSGRPCSRRGGRRASTTILTRSSRARIGSKHASRRRRRRLSTAGVRRRRHPLPSEFTTTGDWERVDLTRTERSPIISGSGVPEGVPSGIVDPGERVSFGLETREATVKRVAVAEWERVTVERGPNGSVVDDAGPSGDHTRRGDRPLSGKGVGIGEHAPTDGAPDRATATFGAGDASDGPAPARPPIARVDLDVDTENGVDRITEDAISGGEVTRSTTVGSPIGGRSERRCGRRGRTRERRARHRDRGVDGGCSGRRGGTVRRSADAIRDRRAELVDAPVTYDGAADRAGTAARTAYSTP